MDMGHSPTAFNQLKEETKDKDVSAKDFEVMSSDLRGKGQRQHFVHNYWNAKAKFPYTLKLLPEEQKNSHTFKVD